MSLCRSSPLCLSLPTLSTHPTPTPSSFYPSPSQLESQVHAFLLDLQLLHSWSDYMDLPNAPCDSNANHFLLREAAQAKRIKISNALLPCQGEWASEVISLITADRSRDGPLALGIWYWGSVMLVDLCCGEVDTHWAQKATFCRQTKMYVPGKSRELGKRQEDLYRHTWESSELLTPKFWLLFFMRSQWVSCQSLYPPKLHLPKPVGRGSVPCK